MKCKQKLCFRNKNLEQSGNCSVCENAIVGCIKDFNKNKKEINKKVEVDLKLMLDTHEKLARGILVDQHVISNLLLGGIINILEQHDTIEEMEKRIKVVEEMSLTDKIRIEALENWALKQADDLKVQNERVSRMKTVQIMKD
jgi:hypothetical protein